MNLRARIMACICIISVLISLMILSNAVRDLRHDVQYTVHSEAVVTNTGTYFAENWNDEGHIYRINSDGSVRDMLDTGDLGEKVIHGLCVGDGNIYAVFSGLLGSLDEHITYRVFNLSPDLKVINASKEFMIDSNESISALTWSEGNVYITTIEGGGESVYVYNLSTEDFVNFSGSMIGINEKKDDEVEIAEPEPSLFRNNPAGSIFVDAVYRDGVLNVLTDSDKPEGEFKADSRVQTVIDRIHFSLLQKMSLYHEYISYWLIGIVIWLFILALIYVMLQRRNRVVYVYFLTELMLFLILFSSFYFIARHYQKVAKEENARYASMIVGYELNNLGDLDDYGLEKANYPGSTEYVDLRNKLTEFMESGDNSVFFLDIFVMRRKDGYIMNSYLGDNFQPARHVYGNGMEVLRTSLNRNPREAMNDADIEGWQFEAAGTAGMNPASKYALVGVYVSGVYYAGFWSDVKYIFPLFLMIFIITSVLIALVMFLQHQDLRRFEGAMRDVALGRKNVVIPSTPAMDLKAMWASLGELEKKIDEINYDKYRIFEGYYRFAPKNIETIMGRESIFDVHNGDVTRAEGTLMLVSTERIGYGDRRVKSLRNVVSYMSQYSDREEGILVSQDSTLSILQFLFMKDNKSVCAQTTQFLHRNASDKDSAFVSVFLYYDEFLYGVVGINTQSLTFLTSRHPREMEEYAAWFGRLRIPLIVTREIVTREDAGESRFIGYIHLPGEEEKLPVYEVLDACNAKQRQLRLITREKFEETLDLFYSRDYYLARNNFSEILKESPDDTVARWYLFECERYLNGEEEMPDEGYLRITE